MPAKSEKHTLLISDKGTSLDLKATLLRPSERAFISEVDGRLISGVVDNERDSSERNRRGRRCLRTCKKIVINKSFLSMFVTFFILCTGILLVIIGKSTAKDLNDPVLQAAGFIVNAGLFGFLSGLCNLLATVLVFHGVGLPGTGVIGGRYKQIRLLLKDIVLNMLLDSEFLTRYMTQQVSNASTRIQIKENVETALASSESEELIYSRLSYVFTQPENEDLRQIGITQDTVYPVLKPILLSLCAESAPLVTQELSDTQQVDSEQLRRDIESYLEWRIKDLTKRKLQKVMFKLIFRHLDWIVVWGCVVGVAMGIVTEGLRISTII